MTKKRQKRITFFIQIVLGTIFLSLGIFGFTYMADVKKDGESSVSWSSTSGKVIKRTLRHRSNSRSTSLGTPYYIIEYTYAVNKVQYTGERIRFDKDAVSSAAAGNRQVGDAVDVYYAPEDPQKSALVKGYHGGRDDNIWFWFSIGFTVMGGVSIALGVKGMLFGAVDSESKE